MLFIFFLRPDQPVIGGPDSNKVSRGFFSQKISTLQNYKHPTHHCNQVQSKGNNFAQL